MVERQRPFSVEEISSLHERGGLTPEHWQVIAAALPKNSKAGQFAEAVLDGRINPSGFAHREYLSSMVWWDIESKCIKLTTNVSGLIGRRFRPKNYQLAKEIEMFSEKEKMLYCTFDELLGLELGGMTWNYEEGCWGRIHESWSLEDERGYEVLPYGVTRTGFIPLSGDSSRILSSYCLKQTDVFDVFKTSPSELLQIARTKVPVEEMREKLKSRARNRIIVGWEKPIPQIA